MRLHRLLSATVLSLSFPLAAFAASGEVLVDTPLLQEARTIRTKDFMASYLKFRTTQTQFAEKRATFLRKRAEARQTCREDIRRSNRDTKLTVTLRCFANELKLEQELLMKEQEIIDQMPGLNKSIRSIASTRLELLTDAIDAMLLGINTNVFSSTEELMKARANLTEKYRKPLLEAKTNARVHQILVWAGEMYTLTKSAGEGYEELSQCLLKLEADASLYLSTEGETGSLTELLTSARACGKHLGASGSGSVMTPQP